ncbi:MAG: 3-hydroxyacyl-CoA dehydrogenase [Hydrocarboniphaga sp.]|uniref:3-hydroxyacyl-CoA dehydrogenase NAD-binding domain-containing protein n=1 Tax=Hydrocarboniphaga sp. TaxID=2033016 RepID=UPI00262124C9|nr:3-hydroxyacyl-CoA dehydrogenase NAD-binding domain-containing protein [Hydrocarboniphaga sp.]MDB5970069.1 3-hydroxyacyl-CoA dehydrogenase [Hydrocarboniphaga sp.]
MENFKLELDADGILTAALDVAGRSMNTITQGVFNDLEKLIARVKTDAAVKGLVLCSGKANGYCAGADLDEQDANNSGAIPSSEAAIRAELARVAVLSDLLRALELCGKPVASAINGLALGGGLEMLLATHYRVAVDDTRIQLGLPEARIGLLPGAGGTQRLPRLIGLAKSLPLLLDGNSVTPAKARDLGFVDLLVSAGKEIETAKAWIRGGGIGSQPWDRKGYKLPGGSPYEAVGVAMTMAIAGMRKATSGNYPAQLNILRCVYEGVTVPIDTGLRLEARYFVLTQNTPQAKAMVRSLFLSMQELKKRSVKIADSERREVRKLAILGAGMMGAGIAQVSAQVGIEVVLIDRSDADAARGKAAIEKQLAKAVDKGRTTRDKADALLARITATGDYSKVEGSDLVIEAVFEDRKLKADVTAKAEAYLGAEAVFGSNTSGLPITGLAQHSKRPENFIGMHFFSPVDRMALVEIIRGDKTSEKTLARAVDFVQKIRKTPIIVRDSRGFYTSRSFHTYLDEGYELLADGVSPIVIDNIGRATGMPRGPLELCDDVGLDLCLSARQQAKADLGDAFVATQEDRMLALLVSEQGRHGRKNGKGFYDYPADGGDKLLWPGLAEFVSVKLKNPGAADIEEIRQRLLYRQSLEAARIFADGVIDDPRDADIGALLGWGFPSWTGGPLSLIDQIGTAEFVRRCDRLAARHGARFAVPSQLREMADRNAAYYAPVAPVVSNV